MSSSSSTISLYKTLEISFTDDIWSEICLHLPIKSIYKFKCVSKVWLSLLSEPSFMNKWIQINTPSPWTLFYNPDINNIATSTHSYLASHSKLFSDHDGFSLKFVNQKRQSDFFLVLGASNGLVLCLSKYYYVCNPLTKKQVLLPSPPVADEQHFPATAFVCECSSTSVNYKVIRIPHFGEGSNKFIIELFSSELGSWNVYQVLCPPPNVITWGTCLLSSAVVNKGILYWIEEKNRMIVYDLNEKNDGCTCRLIDLPDHVNRDFNRCLGVAEGLICLGVIEVGKGALSVWVYEEEQWHVLHKDIELPSYLQNHESLLHVLNCYGVRVIQMLGFSPIDKNVVILSTRNYVWAYNIQMGTYEELCYSSFLDKNMPSDSDGEFLFCPYVLQPMPTMLPPPSWTDPSEAQEEPKEEKRKGKRKTRAVVLSSETPGVPKVPAVIDGTPPVHTSSTIAPDVARGTRNATQSVSQRTRSKRLRQ